MNLPPDKNVTSARPTDRGSSGRASATSADQTRETDPIRVLFVEDDEDYRQIISDELSWHGFAVRSFPDGDALLGALDGEPPTDVIILDWRLPTISGIDLLTELRRRNMNQPVVFLTSHAQIDNESLAFTKGALDFIDKTRGVDILVRRLRLVADKPAANPEEDNQIVCGKLALRPTVSRAYWDNVDVELTVSEYDVVHLLASNVTYYMTYREIYNLQYYEGFVAGSGDQGYRINVRSTIKRIRKKFCRIDPSFCEIQTSSALGYRWRGVTAGIGRGAPAP